MMKLDKHIEILLLEHDCVIIPGFGGFIANHAPARLGEKGEGIFLPPYRTICFNQNLQINDGLLIQSYMQAFDASYPDAYKQLASDVEDLVQVLDETGEYHLNGIGVIHKGIGKNITFSPIDSGLLTPSLYGLYSFEIENLAIVEKQREIQRSLQNTNVLPIQSERSLKPTKANIAEVNSQANASEDKSLIIRLNRRWVDVAIAAAASVLLFFLFSYPNMLKQNESDICVAGSLYVNNENKSKIETIVTENAQEKFNISTGANSNVTKSSNETNSVSIQQPTSDATAEATNPDITADKKFVIVLASYVSRTNSEEYINKLKKEGFDQGRYIRIGKISRIIYSEFSTESEATETLLSLRKQSKDFKEAWVLKID